MPEYYIVVAAWCKDGKANCASFGVFKRNSDAARELDRLSSLPQSMIHFADKTSINWTICQDIQKS